MELKRFEKALRRSSPHRGAVNRSANQPILKVNKCGLRLARCALGNVDARDERGYHGGKSNRIASEPLYAATRASTRNGLPDPFSIFSGVVIRTAPVGGN
jgi:hypothetical protein